MAKKILAKLNTKTLNAIQEMTDLENEIKKNEKSRIKQDEALLQEHLDKHEEIMTNKEKVEETELSKDISLLNNK